MKTLNEILGHAAERGREKGLPYSGCLTPAEAQQVRELSSNAVLVDVRTRAEQDFVGRVPGAVAIEWAFYPGMTPNPDFLAQLTTQVDKSSLVMFLCRTGARSHNAAIVAAQAGYAGSYDILEGFEGAANPQTRQRGDINGWRKADLPWTNVA